MGRNEKLSKHGEAGRHSPDRAIPSGSGGSVGGQHSPKDPQGTEDRALNSTRTEAVASKKKNSDY